MWRPTHLELDVAALENNLKRLREWNGPGEFLCPMVKANAYGHGAVQVARTVERVGASALGVALVEEALELRHAGIQMPILVFAPVEKAAVGLFHEHHLTPVVGRLEDLESLLSEVRDKPMGIHLKFNTGMNRLGFDTPDLARLRELLRRHPQLRSEGVCTHLTHGEDVDQWDGPTQTQLRKLTTMSEGFPGIRHAHKSSSLATLARKGLAKTDHFGTRPGIALYGLPHDGDLNGPGLRSALRWVTQIVRVHQVPTNEGVSYGARWVAPRPSTIGVVPVGYGDGYSRALSNRGEMLFRGARVPVVGSVCMDYTLIDLTDVSRDEPAQAGEEIVLLGRQGAGEISAAFLAEKAGTIVYEIVTGISHRVAREAP